MSNTELAVGVCLIYIIGVMILLWAIARARPLRTVDGRTEDMTGGTAAPLQTPITGASSPVDIDSFPVTLKMMGPDPIYYEGEMVTTYIPVLFIERCPDPLMWYREMVGQEVPYLGKWKSDKCYKSREPAGYVNIVKFADARIIVKEVKYPPTLIKKTNMK